MKEDKNNIIPNFPRDPKYQNSRNTRFKKRETTMKEKLTNEVIGQGSVEENQNVNQEGMKLKSEAREKTINIEARNIK